MIELGFFFGGIAGFYSLYFNYWDETFILGLFAIQTFLIPLAIITAIFTGIGWVIGRIKSKN